MVKRLINKLRKGVILATAWLLFGGCQSPYEPQPPKAIVYANPNSGDAPLESRITLNGEDPDGDIAEYKIEIDDGADGTIEETVTQNTPIDITRTFSDGNVKVYGQCTDSTGLKSRKEVYITLSPTSSPSPEPTPIPYKTVSGRLQDNETDTNQEGEVRLYIDDVLTHTDSDGENFNFSVPYNSNVKLKGVIKDGSTQKSYVRTKDLGNVTEDVDIDLRAVPYPNFDTNNDSVIDATDYANFKTHMNETNIVTSGTTYLGLSKWNLDNQFLGIKIYKNDDGSSFTQEQAEFIRDKIKENENIEQFIEGRQLDNKIEITEEEFTYPAPDYYISVIPNSTMWQSGRTLLSFQDYKTIYKVKIEMDPDCVRSDNPALVHEFGHAFIASNIFDGHAHTLPSEYTIMTTSSNIFQPGVADIKSGKVVNENTYKPGERLDDIFGMSW